MSDSPEDSVQSMPMQPREAADFGAIYQSQPPWDIGRPQAALLRLAEAGRITGRVLDIGCGTGEHALMCAARGLDAVGIDATPAAIDQAKHKATERGLAVRFAGDWRVESIEDADFETVNGTVRGWLSVITRA